MTVTATKTFTVNIAGVQHLMTETELRSLHSQIGAQIINEGGKRIVAAVCNHYTVSPSVLFRSGREGNSVVRRWVCWQLMHEAGMNDSEIASDSMGFDRSTVYHGRRELKDWLDSGSVDTIPVIHALAKLRKEVQQ